MKNSKNKNFLLKIGVISLILLVFCIPSAQAATVDKDPKDDQYSVSVLSFFYVLGSSYDDDPDSIEPFRDAIENLIQYSTGTASHGEIDIRETIYEIEDGLAVIGISFEDSIEDEDIIILGIGEHDGDMFSFRIETNSTMIADCHYTSEATGDSNDTLAWVVDEDVAFYCNEEDFEWEDGDDLIILALTMPEDFEGPADANSKIYWDFSPNEEIPEQSGSYSGPDIITDFIDSIAAFLFPFLPGGLSFKFLMTLLIVVGQVFLDRKKRWMRWAGLIFMLLLYYPLIQYAFALDFSLTMFGMNYISVLELMILLNLMIYIAFAVAVSFNVLRLKNMFFITASGLMISESVLFLTLFNPGGTTPIFSLVFLSFTLAGLLVCLVLSRKFGRTPK